MKPQQASDELLIRELREQLEGIIHLRIPLGTPLKAIEEKIVRLTFALVGGSATACANALQIDRRTVYRVLARDTSRSKRQ